MFSLVASKERQHGETLSIIRRPTTKVLPVVAIYGGNASGKSNLFQALVFVRKFVVWGTNVDASIAVEPFLLDEKHSGSPSSFVLEFEVQERTYQLSFTVNRKEVTEEVLLQLLPTSEREIYYRRGNSLRISSLHLTDEQNADVFQFVYEQSMRGNQLFLTTGVGLNISEFKSIFEWFRDDLKLIGPQERSGSTDPYSDNKDPLARSVVDILSELDTGIVDLRGEKVNLDHRPFPPDLKKELLDTLPEGERLSFSFQGPGSDRLVLTNVRGELVAKRLVSYHAGASGAAVKFNLQQESDGTIRIIDLLPCFLDLADSSSSTVYFIDELDRSLHTMLTRTLLEWFLGCCGPQNRSQLMFTTHDLLLMEQDLMRRDEMYLTERNSDGSTNLIGFSEYRDIRNDKDIRKSYLAGRLGGIPQLSNILPCDLGREKEAKDQ